MSSIIEVLEAEREKLSAEEVRLRRMVFALQEDNTGDSVDNTTMVGEKSRCLDRLGAIPFERAYIERLLAKHRNGNGHLCSDCGDPIPPERLEALPKTDLCMFCVGKLERAGTSDKRRRH